MQGSRKSSEICLSLPCSCIYFKWIKSSPEQGRKVGEAAKFILDVGAGLFLGGAKSDSIAYGLWHFGDGLTSTLPGPSHTYALTGSFGVTLTVIGPGGTNALFKDKFITVTNQFIVYLPVVVRSH